MTGHNTNKNPTLSKFPVWDYGTTCSNHEPPNSASSSGLMLREQGVMAVVQPEVLQNYLFPIGELLESKISTYRNNINKLVCSTDENPIPPLLSTEPDSPVSNFEIVSTALFRSEKHKPPPPEPRYPEDSFHKLLIITGPSSLTIPSQSIYCSQWIAKLAGHRTYSFEDAIIPLNTYYDVIRKQVMKLYCNAEEEFGAHFNDVLLISMRANATNYEPSLLPSVYSSRETHIGIPLYRTWLHELAQHCPITVNLSNTIMPQYIADLCCLGLCEPGYLESQLHRELVSGCSYPCGFQTDSVDKFKLNKCKEAMISSSVQHSFLTITKNGSVAHVETTGNEDTFAVVPIKELIKQKAYSEKNEFPITDNSSEETLVDYDYSGLVNEIMNELLIIAKEVSVGRHKLKLLIDLGKIEQPLEQLTNEIITAMIRNEEFYKHLLGFMIDSGDWYLPGGVRLQEVNPFNYNQNEDDNVFQYNNLKSKLQSNEGFFADDTPPVENYAAILGADRMIKLIGDEVRDRLQQYLDKFEKSKKQEQEEELKLEKQKKENEESKKNSDRPNCCIQS